MFHTETDPKTRLLRITYSGSVSPDETRKCLEQAKVGLQNWEPGFRVLTDLAGLEAMDVACLPSLRELMDFLDEKGVALIVRIIPDPHKDIGLNILSLFHYHRRVRIATCGTLADGLKLLDN